MHKHEHKHKHTHTRPGSQPDKKGTKKEERKKEPTNSADIGILTLLLPGLACIDKQQSQPFQTRKSGEKE